MATPVTVTVGSGKTYTNLAAFIAWVTTQNLVALDQVITAEVYDNQTVGEWTDWVWSDEEWTDATRYAIIRPAAGLSFRETAGPIVAMPSTGLTISMAATGGYCLNIHRGFVIEGFRITGTNSGTRSLIETQCGADIPLQGGLRWCAISCTSATASVVSLGPGGVNYGAKLQDCYVQGPGSTGTPIVYVRDDQVVERCTIVSLDNTKRAIGVEVEYSLTPIVRNNAIHGGMDFVYLSSVNGTVAANSVKNYYTGSLTKTGAFTEFSAGAFISSVAADIFNSPTTNFTPKSGGALVGAANSTANNTLDINGVNRSTGPDAGAIELATTDTTPPTLSSPTASGSGTTASGGATTTEAGPAWGVIATTATTPTAAQIKLGQNHTGAAAVAAASGTFAIGANNTALAFSGLTASLDYYIHIVQDDAVTPTANVSTPVTYGPFQVTPVDGTAPTLSSPTSSTTGTTTGTGTVSTNEANGTLYAVVSTSATPPTAAQIRAGQMHTGATAAFAGNQSITTTGVKTFNATGLSPGTVYYFHYHHRDAANNDSAVSTSASFTTTALDTTPPTLSSPTSANTGTTTGTGTVSTNEANGTIYAVVTTSSTPPTAAQVRAGQNHTGAAAAYNSNQSVSTTGVKTFNATGLSPGTLYYFHFHHRDAANNDSTVSTSASFTTTASDTTAPTLSSPTGAQTGTTTGTGTVSTNEANGTLYAVVSTSATPPSSAQMVAGQMHTGAAAAFAANQSITTTGTKTQNSTGLTPGGTYYYHFMHRDAASNDSTVATSGGFTTPVPDTTAPTLSSPQAVVKSNALIVLNVTTNEANGTLYAVITNSATPPTAAQIRAGQNHAGAAAIFAANQAISSIGAKTFNGIVPNASTLYYVYFHHRDAANNDSTIVSASGTSFADGATGQYILDNTGPVGDNEGGILFNDVEAGDEDKWFSFEIVTPPDSGTLDIEPDGTFTFLGSVNSFFTYQLYVDGVAIKPDGTPGVEAALVVLYAPNRRRIIVIIG